MILRSFTSRISGFLFTAMILCHSNLWASGPGLSVTVADEPAGVTVLSAADESSGGLELFADAVDESAGNLPCFKIKTPSAVYYLEKEGAGLSSLLDRDGVDWIGFHPDKGTRASGEFRGFPNAVHQQDGSFFHPKNSGTEVSTTRVVYAGPDRITIAAESGNNNWAALWHFTADHATFTMTRMPDGYAYWILYEGTPGGGYDDSDWWMTSAVREKTPLTVNHEGDIPDPEWIVFGDKATPRVLFLLHHEDDSHIDKFYAMEKAMTVFGFGRQGMTKFLRTVPRSFSIGFVESTSHQKISEALKALSEQ